MKSIIQRATDRFGPACLSVAVLSACAGHPTAPTAPADEPFWRDAQGRAHGTGIKEYRYNSGEVMIRERYVQGELLESDWFKPDGTPVQHTHWRDGSGEGIYLRRDGTVRARFQYVRGVAEGEAVFYSPDGSVLRREKYRSGSPVHAEDPAAK